MFRKLNGGEPFDDAVSAEPVVHQLFMDLEGRGIELNFCLYLQDIFMKHIYLSYETLISFETSFGETLDTARLIVSEPGIKVHRRRT